MKEGKKFGLFRKKSKKTKIVIGEPYDVKHVYHVGLDSGQNQIPTDFNRLHSQTNSKQFQLI